MYHKNGFFIQLLFFIFFRCVRPKFFDKSKFEEDQPIVLIGLILTKDIESRCILSPATIFEETAIPRKSEKAGISCAGWFIQDSSFLVVNTLAKPSVSRDEIGGESQERRRDVRL
ncbi:hypothetical protein P5V15_007611 [Pogonomyrmex californicus]